MSPQIIPQATIDRVMGLLEHLDMDARHMSEKIRTRLENAKNTRDVARLLSLFENGSRGRGPEDPMGVYYTEISALLTSVDGVREALENITGSSHHTAMSDRLVAAVMSSLSSSR
jgi:hypothetical protein